MVRVAVVPRGMVLVASLVMAMAADVDPARAEDQSAGSGGEPRPAPSALRLSESDLLSRFTPEVRRTPLLRERALDLWRAHFAPTAQQLVERLAKEEDWRPVLADAGALIDEFLEASLLPRVGQWPVQGEETEKVWVEKLDRRTGQRIRVQKPVRRPENLFAPEKN